MPFKSEAQKRWMYANHPKMAKRWQKHTPPGKLPQRVHNSKVDPSRTITLRRGLSKRLRMKYRKLKAALVRLVLHDNAFALNTRWSTLSDDQKLRSFQVWLKRQLGNDGDVWEKYISQSYAKGMRRSYQDVRGAQATQGGLDEHLLGASVDDVKALVTRGLSDMDGVDDRMARKMIRKLADGLARGDSAKDIAKSLADEADAAGFDAETVARTEIVRAHAEGQLRGLKRLGVKGVTAQVEYAAAADACPDCASYDGAVFDVDEAHGVIPMHPNCRCAWLPVVDDEPTDNYNPNHDELGRFASGGIGPKSEITDEHAEFWGNPSSAQLGKLLTESGPAGVRMLATGKTVIAWRGGDAFHHEMTKYTGAKDAAQVTISRSSGNILLQHYEPDDDWLEKHPYFSKFSPTPSPFGGVLLTLNANPYHDDKGRFASLSDGSIDNWDRAISWHNEVPYEVGANVREYQGMRAEQLNSMLAAGQTLEGKNKDIDDSLQNLLDSGHFNAVGTVLRGIDSELTGGVYAPKHWLSTTTSFDVARRFAVTGGAMGRVGGVPGILRIRTRNGLLLGGPESEVILPKNVRYRIASKTVHTVKANDWSDDKLDIPVYDLEPITVNINPYHDDKGRFASAPSGLEFEAPTRTGVRAQLKVASPYEVDYKLPTGDSGPLLDEDAGAALDAVDKVFVKKGYAGVKFYHGTAADAVEAIKREGLKPGGSPGSDAWAAEHGMHVQDFTIGDRKASVFLAMTKKTAEYYAEKASEVRGAEPVILTINMPKDAVAPLHHDEMDNSAVAWRYKGKIPPEWITFNGRVVYGVLLCHTGVVNFNPNHDEKGEFTSVGKAEHVRAAEIEREVAAGLGGKWMEDNEYYDVEAGPHRIEVKSRLKGAKPTITVHDDALLRKVQGERARGARGQFHTVVVDERDTYEGGIHAEHYSGHRLYYKRGSGRYSLAEMHPVADYAELKKLLDTPTKELPEKAKGELPRGKEAHALRKKAERAHESRLAKDRARKARLKLERSS